MLTAVMWSARPLKWIYETLGIFNWMEAANLARQQAWI